MKFFVKNDKGEFVEATSDQILSADSVLYNEEKELLNRQTVQEDDPVKELAGVVKDLAVQVGGLAGIKEKQTKIEEKLGAYEDAAKKGLVLPQIDGDTTVDDAEKIC
jgi:hypothetical protein